MKYARAGNWCRTSFKISKDDITEVLGRITYSRYLDFIKIFKSLDM